MTLSELGAQLREGRIALGLMVEDVAARLKVPSRILRSIEDGKVGDLPHTVYTRGFIKGYANIIGYSNENITALLDSLEDFDDDFSPPKTDPLPTKGFGPTPHKGLSLAIKLFIVLLIAAGGYMYYNHTFRNDDSQVDLASFVTNDGTQNNTAVPQNPAVNQPDSAAPQENEPVWPPVTEDLPEQAPIDAAVTEDSASNNDDVTAATDQTTDTPPAPAVEQSLDGPAQVIQPQNPVSEARPERSVPLPDMGATAAAAPAAPASPIAAPVLPDGMHQIVLTAHAECWVHANADGTVTREFSLQVGETFAMPFTTSLLLKLGNAGGVTIKYDGVEQPPAGTSGQVRTITFPPSQ